MSQFDELYDELYSGYMEASQFKGKNLEHFYFVLSLKRLLYDIVHKNADDRYKQLYCDVSRFLISRYEVYEGMIEMVEYAKTVDEKMQMANWIENHAQKSVLDILADDGVAVECRAKALYIICERINAVAKATHNREHIDKIAKLFYTKPITTSRQANLYVNKLKQIYNNLFEYVVTMNKNDCKIMFCLAKQRE